jgi:hypothetical protein
MVWGRTWLILGVASWVVVCTPPQPRQFSKKRKPEPATIVFKKDPFKIHLEKENQTCQQKRAAALKDRGLLGLLVERYKEKMGTTVTRSGTANATFV